MTNFAVAPDRDNNHLGLAILFLAITLLLWWWMRRDDALDAEAERDAAEAARLKVVNAAEAAQRVAEVTERRIEGAAKAAEEAAAQRPDEPEGETVEAEAIFDENTAPQDQTPDAEDSDDPDMPDGIDATEEPAEQILVEAKAGDPIAEDIVAEAEAAKPVNDDVVEITPEDDPDGAAPQSSAQEDDEPAPPLEDAAQAAADETDDLLRIEGIGPYYRDLLLDAGINTYAKLAVMTQDEIDRAILDAGGRRTSASATWAEQAKLADNGEWDALTKLQDELTGGRRED